MTQVDIFDRELHGKTVCALGNDVMRWWLSPSLAFAIFWIYLEFWNYFDPLRSLTFHSSLCPLVLYTFCIQILPPYWLRLRVFLSNKSLCSEAEKELWKEMMLPNGSAIQQVGFSIVNSEWQNRNSAFKKDPARAGGKLNLDFIWTVQGLPFCLLYKKQTVAQIRLESQKSPFSLKWSDI